MEGEYQVSDVDQMRALGKSFAEALQVPEVVYLEGDLGAGKTTFITCLLQLHPNSHHP